MHYDIIAAVLPTLAVLTGIPLNRNDYSKLDGRLSSIEGRLDNRISALDGKIGTLDARFHTDMLLVIGKLTELDVRVARLEEKQAR